METTTQKSEGNNRMLSENYPPKTIEEQDQAVQVKTTSEMTQTQYSTQEEAITTNIIEESPGTASDNEAPLSQDEKTTTNVKIQTTESIEIPTTVQSWLSTSINQDEDTTKEANEIVITTDQTTTIWDDGTDFETEELEFTTVKSLNKLLWNTLVEEQKKEKPANYNRKNIKYGGLYSDEEEVGNQEDTMQSVDIKERKYNIKESTDEQNENETEANEEEENGDKNQSENHDNDRNNEDEESKQNKKVGDIEDGEENEVEEDYKDFDESEDYQYDIDTSNISNILSIFCIIISDHQSSIKKRTYNIKGGEESDNQSKTSFESNDFDDSANETEAQSLSG